VFGIVKPCRHTLPPDLRDEWRAHLCGQCLSLRNQHGQAARLTTNVDAIVLSVLVEAQLPERSSRTVAGACPLRGMRTANVVDADAPSMVHATAVSLSMAAAKVGDHALDHDGWVGRFPRTSLGVARRWAAEGEMSGRRVQFDTGVLADAVADSNRREQQLGASFEHYVAPTEEAAAAAFRHTAVVSSCPENIEDLAVLGRNFGRITYLLDAVDDEQEDLESGSFNVLVATIADPAQRHQEAARLFAIAYADLVAAFDRLSLSRPALARALLVDEVARAGRRRFGHAASCAVGRTENHRHDSGQSVRPRGHLRHPVRHVAFSARQSLRSMAVVARVGVLVGLHLPGFQPGVGPGMPMGPTPEQLEEQRRRNEGFTDQGFAESTDAGGCGSDCDCCCCCDGCCCDGCDCCDC